MEGERYDRALAVIAKALDGARTFHFVLACRALEVDLDDCRVALGQTREEFAAEWGGFLSAIAERDRLGDAARAAKAA